jgi:hypothetical protein
MSSWDGILQSKMDDVVKPDTISLSKKLLTLIFFFIRWAKIDGNNDACVSAAKWISCCIVNIRAEDIIINWNAMFIFSVILADH